MFTVQNDAVRSSEVDEEEVPHASSSKCLDVGMIPVTSWVSTPAAARQAVMLVAP